MDTTYLTGSDAGEIDDQFSALGISSNPAGQDVTKIIDNSDSTKWLIFLVPTDTSPVWVRYHYPSDRQGQIYSYTVTSANDYPSRDPRIWNLEGSNNNSDWAVLDTQSDIIWPSDTWLATYTNDPSNEVNYTSRADAGRFVTKTFDLAATDIYNYYRLSITSVLAQRYVDNSNNPYQPNNGCVQIAEIQLIGAIIVESGMGGGGGDPHIQTLSGEQYTVPSSINEFTFLESELSNGDYLMITCTTRKITEQELTGRTLADPEQHCIREFNPDRDANLIDGSYFGTLEIKYVTKDKLCDHITVDCFNQKVKVINDNAKAVKYCRKNPHKGVTYNQVTPQTIETAVKIGSAGYIILTADSTVCDCNQVVFCLTDRANFKKRSGALLSSQMMKNHH